MDKIIWLIFILIFLLLPQYAFAHTLDSNETVGAVMHISPEDDPAAGEQSSINFELKDTANSFKPENCECIFTVNKNNKALYSQPLFQNNTDPNSLNASVPYIFPEKGEYVLHVIGIPRFQENFRQFVLEYKVNVQKTVAKVSVTKKPDAEVVQPIENSEKKDNGLLLPYLISALLILAGVLLILRLRKRK